MHLFISKRLGWGIRAGVITGPLLSTKRCAPHPVAFVVGLVIGGFLLYIFLH